jgi:hypothetical protein
MIERDALASGVGPVVGDVGDGAIRACSRIDRETGSPRDDRPSCQPPATPFKNGLRMSSFRPLPARRSYSPETISMILLAK